MEEKILQIINNKFYDYKNKIGKTGSTGQFKMQTAKEITSLIEQDYYEKDFVDWLQRDCEGFNDGWRVYNDSLTIIAELEDTEQAYEYWKTLSQQIKYSKMKTAIDKNESEFDRLKREALEWIENPKSRLVPSFIKIAVETAQQAQPDKGDKPTGQFEEDYPVYDEKYLNECIKKAKPNLSKIKDVDKTLDEIRGNGTDKEIMTKQEIIKLYLGDLKNIVKESPARNNRIAILESELSAIDKQVKEAENTPVESKNNVELFEKIEKLKRDITKKRKRWVFPNEGYIEATGMIMICDQILDWIKIESQELPAEENRKDIILNFINWYNENTLGQYIPNSRLGTYLHEIKDSLLATQPHSDIVSDSEIGIEANRQVSLYLKAKNNPTEDLYKRFVHMAKFVSDRQRMKLRDKLIKFTEFLTVKLHYLPENRYIGLIDEFIQSLNKE